VKPQTVVTAPPGSARFVTGLEHERIKAALSQQRRRCQAGRTTADDHDFARFHAGVLPLGATPSKSCPLTI